MAGLDDVMQYPTNGTELNPESNSPSVCPTVEASPPGSTILVRAHTPVPSTKSCMGKGDCNGLGVVFFMD